MSTNKTKQTCLAIIIGVIAFVLTLLSEMSLAADGDNSSSSGTGTNTEVVSEMTTTSADGDRVITEYTVQRNSRWKRAILYTTWNRI